MAVTFRSYESLGKSQSMSRAIVDCRVCKNQLAPSDQLCPATAPILPSLTAHVKFALAAAAAAAACCCCLLLLLQSWGLSQFLRSMKAWS
jgi:hypothetical protein